MSELPPDQSIEIDVPEVPDMPFRVMGRLVLDSVIKTLNELMERDMVDYENIVDRLRREGFQVETPPSAKDIAERRDVYRLRHNPNIVIGLGYLSTDSLIELRLSLNTQLENVEADITRLDASIADRFEQEIT